ncbi:tripartite tricarboxylate transporter TctB family protein [Pedobacter sp. P351]|uniref:tripartite tricarboxylate transporter TctB family protein n=1 Tax=Pedobacter superstes TaxID=3133441 RepID=UPI003094B9D3
MNIPEICITFIAALLGVAYPILLEVVSRLDEKYSSLIVIDLFKKESEWKYFRFFLATSLIGVVLYIALNLPFLPFVVPSIAMYIFVSLLIISTILLVIYFLLFVKKIMTYYSTNQVVQYFNRQPEKEEHIYFQAISDILHLSIKKQDTVVAKTASEFIYKKFREVRANSKGVPVLYPDVYYQMVYKTVQELIFSRDERFIYLEHRSLGGVWLLGEHDECKIHENTYSWMWHGLVMAVRHERDDMVMQYWGVVHQYFIYELKAVHRDLITVGEDIIVQNQNEVSKREEERARFLEYNHALGGLLLYKNRLNSLKRIFRYTTSTPPSYDLLPLSMNQVFNIYFKFRDPYDYNFPFITTRYNFPESEGIQGEGVVKYWICKYSALLFLRQYIIVPYMVYIEPLVMPQIPTQQSEKRLWIDNIDHFQFLVNELLGEKETLEGVGLGFMNDQWFADKNKVAPNEFIKALKQNLVQAFEDVEQNQPISNKKRQAFFDGTKNIISETLQPYQQTLKQDLDGETNSWFVPSITMVAEKSALSDNQDVHHTNFDTFLASRQSERIRKSISETFFMKANHSYLLKTNDLYAAIDSLSLDSEKYIIINFGIDLNYHIHYASIKGLSQSHYNSIPLISFTDYNRALMNATFYILEKESLPAIICKRLENDQINKYSLEEIDENNHIYVSVIDLNVDAAIRQEVEAEGSHTQLNKSVLMYIGNNIEIRWKKNVNMVAFAQYSEFSNRGVPNDLSDVKSPW